MNRRLTLCLLLMLCLPALAPAQTPTLVADLNPNPPAKGTAGSDPRRFAGVNGHVVFVTRDPEAAVPTYRLWATQGSAATTEPLALLCDASFCQPPRLVARTARFALYEAIDPSGSGATSRLWRTDGTRAGTFPLDPLFYSFDFPVQAAVVGQRVFFGLCEDSSLEGCDLWVSDGSAAGTRVVKEGIRVSGIIPVGNRAVFLGFAAGPPGIQGIWSSDGTAAGTILLREGYADTLTAAGARAFFLMGNGDYPNELWATDGTRKGTLQVLGVGEGSHYFPRNTRFLKAVPGGIVFVAYGPDQSALNLWKSDGTRKGTRRLTDFSDGELGPLREDQIAVLGDRLLFVATNTTGPRLWATRGTPATTAPVTGCAGGCPALDPETPVVAVNRRVVFAAEDNAHGMEPWSSNGTGAGTRLLRDLCAGPCDSDPEAFTEHAGKVDFRATWNGVSRMVRTNGVNAVLLANIGDTAADDGRRLDLADLLGLTVFAGLDRVYGLQPFGTDGTRLNTYKIANVENGAGSSNPQEFTVLGDRLLFAASDGHQRLVWTVTRGVPGPPAALPIPGGATELEAAGGFVFAAVDRGAAGSEIWRTDGTAAGTLLLATVPGHTLSDLHAVGNQVLFLAVSTTGEQPVFAVWGSDGTLAGTGPRFDLPADTIQVPVTASLPSGYYLLRRSETGAEILHSGGAVAPPERILLAVCDCVPDVVRFYTSEGTDYFTAWGHFGLGLFTTDGTAAGTTQIFPTTFNTQIAGGSVALFHGDFYFITPGFDAPTSTPLLNLQRLHEGGQPVLVKTFGYPPAGPLEFEFRVAGDRLFFTTWEPGLGFELWKTDGTTAGTALVKDIAPGGASSYPQSLTAAGGRLWFSARDATHGRELWVSDGTAAGTVMVGDIAAGPLSSAPEGLTPFDGFLYFSAEGAEGREPWRVEVNP